MDNRIMELLKAGATPEQIYEEAKAAKAKLNEDQELKRCREDVIDALFDYLDAIIPGITNDISEQEIEVIRNEFKKMENQVRGLAKATKVPVDDKKVDETINKFLKAIGAI